LGFFFCFFFLLHVYNDHLNGQYGNADHHHDRQDPSQNADC
jgi:hypothetical protein